MFTAVIILLIALTVLVWSADKFVFGASSVARNFGISPMIVGLTIVAMGSSAPEMMVAVSASLQGSPNTAIGNAIGSNITNIALVLGITALCYPLTVSSNTVKKELPLILLITALAYLILFDVEFSFYEGIGLFILFAVYILSLLIITLKRKKNNAVIDDPLLLEAEEELGEQIDNPKAIMWLVLGMVLLPLSAHYLVDSSIVIAKYFGLSDLVIGLTIIAIGTSLPELAASLVSIWKKEDDLALGNIIGSNIFNILAVLPFAGVIAPGAIDGNAVTRDAPYMLAVTLLLFVLCFSRQKGFFRITRLKGGILFLCFIGYQVMLFSQA
jgi:cation:H+ antiporter